MYHVPENERQWVDIFSHDDVSVEGLTFSMCEYNSQEGVVFPINCKEHQCSIWLPVQLWRMWCEGQLGTADMSAIDPLLLLGIAEWGLSPLLRASNARLCPGECPVFCSNLPNQITITVSWCVEEYAFQALFFHWPAFFFNTIAEKIIPVIRQANPTLPVELPLYIGWSQLMLAEVGSIQTGVGVRFNCFGDARVGSFAIELPGGVSARVSLTAEECMRFDELAGDIETLLGENNENLSNKTTAPINLDELPQILLFEVGKMTVELGRLRQLQEGDILPASEHFTPEVTLRLNGKVVGRGELVLSGDDFLVRITRWYLR